MHSFSLATAKRGIISALIAGSILIPSIAGAVTLYAGQPKEQAGLTLTAWGSGSISDSSDRRYNGEKSIKVVTQGLYSGGCIEFNNPVDLNFGDPNSKEYLQFVVNYNTMITLNPTGYTYGQVYGGYDYGTGSSDLIRIPKVNKVRLVFVDAKGKSVEIQQPAVSTEDDEGWPRINIPLAALKLPEGEKTFSLKKVMIFTDLPETLFISEIKTLSDDTPITCSAGDDKIERANDVLFFRATAEGGASTLVYSWDFDNKDGIQEDAGGPIVLHVYRKSGNYVVTLTVRDANGLRKAATSTLNVECND